MQPKLNLHNGLAGWVNSSKWCEGTKGNFVGFVTKQLHELFTGFSVSTAVKALLKSDQTLLDKLMNGVLKLCKLLSTLVTV